MDASSHVVHLVGNVTAQVRSLMAPAVAVLQSARARQTIVMIGQEKGVATFGPPRSGVRVIVVDAFASPWRRWMAFRREVDRLLSESAPTQLHVHGILPWIATYGLRRKRLRTIYFTPHSSRALPLLRPIIRVGMSLESIVMQRVQLVMLPSRPLDARRLHWLESRPVIWGSVDAALLTRRRAPSAMPLLVATSEHRRPRDIDAFCKIAVVLGATMPGTGFVWSGPATVQLSQRLEAAGIRVEPPSARSELLAQAWIHVSFDGDCSGPARLLEAMALGVPCVVPQSTLPGNLIVHGINGLVYPDIEQCLGLLTRLLDDAALREKLGGTARCDARRLFGEEAVQRSLMRSYEFEIGAVASSGSAQEWHAAVRTESGDPAL